MPHYQHRGRRDFDIKLDNYIDSTFLNYNDPFEAKASLGEFWDHKLQSFGCHIITLRLLPCNVYVWYLAHFSNIRFFFTRINHPVIKMSSYIYV